MQWKIETDLMLSHGGKHMAAWDFCQSWQKKFSQVVNTSSAQRCWSTYSFIHNVRRNRLNENRAESLVYVHYNLRLLSHYFDRAYEDQSYKVWDNNPKDDNLEDDTVHMEELEA